VISHDKLVRRLRVVSGTDLRQMLAMGAAILEENVEMVNSLNVFPVPDGDTGTNMLLTVQSALDEVSKTSGDDFGAVAQSAAHGSLMGARGNSGVILSQLFRGIAKVADARKTLGGPEVALALKEGANTAYRGIGKPVEGTILTVAREAADAAVAASQLDGDVGNVLRKAVEAGRQSLERTPELLPALKDAGVVDAGGQGYLLLLEGILMVVTGERIPPVISPVQKVQRVVPVVEEVTASMEYGYCTELLVRGEALPIDEIRRRVEASGSSAMVVGESDLVHIHVHTYQPGEILNVAGQYGMLEKIKVENMQLQHTAYLSSFKSQEPVKVDGVGVVTVAVGGGLTRVFRDLGAAAAVAGGQSMNPSIEELVHGADHAGYARVILLPNNPNVVMTAQQAIALAEIDLKVVPTRTLCEGIAAMVAFNPSVEVESNLAAMAEAAAAVRTVEVTRAVRTTRFNGMQVEEGQAIGLLDGTLVESGNSLEEVALGVLERAGVAEREVVTIYYGEGVMAQEGERLAASLGDRWSHIECQVVEGGQPHYPYLISVE